MPPIWKPKDRVILKHWADTTISEAAPRLNGWETKFIYKIKSLLDRGWTLTEEQENKLEQIYARYTS